MALGRPPRRFSSRNQSEPTRLIGWDALIGTGGGSCRGQLYLTSADWALHDPWLTAVGCTCLWEALEHHCRFRAEITDEVIRIRRELNIQHVNRAHSMRNSFLDGSTTYRKIWHELNLGGVVVCFCVQGRRRSPASVVSFFVGHLGIP